MKQFKCRASQVGKLLTNDRSGKAMGETAKSYIKEWYVSELTGKQKEIKSKYFDRGNAMEIFAIARVSKYYKTSIEKNEIQLENEYFTGTFDARTIDRVIDTKVPFDAFTFPFFDTKIDSDYYAQLQIYMNLTGLRKASLCYCLENGSEEQIQKLLWQIEEPTIDDWEEAERQLSYDHLPDNLRIKVFEFDYDETFIEKAIQRVKDAREFLETIKIN